MNKIINKLWIFILLLFPVNVHAITGGLNISCSPSTVRASGTVTCTITGTSDEIVSAVEAQVTMLTDKATIASFTKNDAWTTGSLDDNKYFNVSVENSTIKDSFTIGTLTLNISENANETNDIRVNIQNVSFTDANDNKVSEGLSGGSATFSIEGKSEPQDTLKGLKSLDIINGVLSPSFSSSFTGGRVDLNADTTTFGISAVANNPDDNIACKNVDDANSVLTCNNIEFKTTGGKESMAIHIEVGEGESLVSYSLIVIKNVPDTIANPELTSLTIGGKTVELQSGKYDGYVVELENVNSYEVSWTLKDDDNYQVVNLSNPTIRTAEGEFIIQIEPKDKTAGLKSENYYIKVVKAGGNPTEQPTQSPKPVTPGNNPQTGGTSAAIMALILFLSLGASIYFYQRNMSSYN